MPRNKLAEGIGQYASRLVPSYSAACHLHSMLTNGVAAQMGLLEDEVSGQTLPTMVQNLSRFLLERVNQDYRSTPAASTVLEQSLFNLSNPVNLDDIVSKVLATSAVVSIKCGYCKTENTRPGTTYVNDLMYPSQKPAGRGGRATKTTFSQTLKMGVERENSIKGWCKICQRYQNLQMRKTIQSVPAVLAINTSINSPDHRRHWAPPVPNPTGTPSWLPEEIGIIVDQGQFFCFEGSDLRHHLQSGKYKIAVYSLIGMVVNVESLPQKPHLAAMINGKLAVQLVRNGGKCDADYGCSGAQRVDTSRRKSMASLQRLLGPGGTQRGSVDI